MFLAVGETNWIQKDKIVSFQVLNETNTIVFNMVNGEKHTMQLKNKDEIKSILNTILLNGGIL